MRLSPKIQIGKYRLSFTMLSLYTFEEETGRKLSVTAGDPRGLRSILRALLIPNHPDITPRQAGAAFTVDQLPEVFQVASDLIAANVPKPRGRGVAVETDQTDWLDVWAFARFDLHLSESEFWALTPLMWDALVRRAQLAAGDEDGALTMEAKVKRLESKVRHMNAMMGGADLTQEPEAISGHRRIIPTSRGKVR